MVRKHKKKHLNGEKYVAKNNPFRLKEDKATGNLNYNMLIKKPISTMTYRENNNNLDYPGVRIGEKHKNKLNDKTHQL